ncbi:hypothetical protein GEMRC1_000576 [Eukaryota sp. GEM-RC1]
MPSSITKNFSRVIRDNPDYFALLETLKRRSPPFFFLEFFRDFSAPFARRGDDGVDDWQPKHYVLKGPFLFQFDDISPKSPATDIIPLKAANISSPIKPKVAPPGSDLCLYLSIKSDYGGKIFLRADKRQQIRAWVELLTAAVEMDHKEYSDGQFVLSLPRMFNKTDLKRFRLLSEQQTSQEYNWSLFEDNDLALRVLINTLTGTVEKRKLETLAAKERVKEEKKKHIAGSMRGLLLAKEWRDAFLTSHGGSFTSPDGLFRNYWDGQALYVTNTETDRTQKVGWDGMQCIMTNLNCTWDGVVLNWKTSTGVPLATFISEFSLPEQLSFRMQTPSPPNSDDEHTPEELRTSELTGTLSELE